MPFASPPRAAIMRYGPKSALSPTIGEPCGLCGGGMLAGEFTTLVRGATDKQFPGTEAHWRCASERARG